MTYRAVALCIIRNEDRLLLEETYDPAVDKVFYRPIGGTIEYGEDSRTTVIREVKEEIGQDIVDPVLISVIENIYPYLQEIGHDIDFIYEAKPANENIYKQEIVEGIEGDKPYRAVWKSLRDFKDNDSIRLVPDGLYKILMNENDDKLTK
ncbi:NUDIX domain protein [compost metagenome]